MQTYYQILTNAGDNEAHLYIYGDIVPYACEAGETSGQSMIEQLTALDVQTIHVHIDSYGGSVSEGWAIYNALLGHPARIITHADGFVASAALYPYLAGDERQASSVSGFFFHPVQSVAYGSAADLRKAADDSDIMTGIGIKAFARTKLTEAQVRSLMDAETWVTPDEALQYGLATSIVYADPEPGHSQSAKGAIFAQLAGKGKPTPEKPKNIMQLMAAALTERS